MWKARALGWLFGLLGLVACAQFTPRPTLSATREVASPSPTRETTLTSPTPSPTFTITPLPSPTPLPTPSATPTPEPWITLVFTGNIVPARCVQAAVDERGGDPWYLYEQVAPWLQVADIAVGGALDATFTDYPPMTGCRATLVLVARGNHAQALARAGLDVIAIPGNHVKDCGLLDCGDRAFLDTLENLHRAGIRPVGGGRNLDEALEPVVLEVKGVRFAFLAWGELRPRNFAGPDTPGIAPLTPENVAESFRRAREAGAQVFIALPHWGPEYDFVPTYLQRNTAQMLVQAGANLVVGNHAHVVQGLQVLDGVPVFYSLGSFVFDQTWGVETRWSVLLRVLFRDTRLVAWELIPLEYDATGRVYPLEGERAQRVLELIWSSSPGGPPPTPVWPPGVP